MDILVGEVVVDLATLKQGDIVVPREGYTHVNLTPGKEYRVISISTYYIHVIGDNDRVNGWMHECWERPNQHKRMPEPDQSLEDICAGQQLYEELEGGK